MVNRFVLNGISYHGAGQSKKFQVSSRARDLKKPL
jgi:hypothetical protein